MQKNSYIGILAIVMLASAGLAQSSGNRTEALRSAYNSFNYIRTDSLISQILPQIASLAREDRFSVLRIAAFRAVEKDSSDLAREYFQQILDRDPTYELDPVATSPKILLLFQQAKVDYSQAIQQRLRAIEAAMAFEKQNRPWRSLVFPGWEQFRRGYRGKGVVWAALGSAAIGTTTWSVLRTRKRYDHYSKEVDRSRLNSRYNQYNSAYKLQFYLGYATAAVWLGSHIDALFFSPVRDLPLTISPHQNQPGLTLTYQF